MRTCLLPYLSLYLEVHFSRVDAISGTGVQDEVDLAEPDFAAEGFASVEHSIAESGDGRFPGGVVLVHHVAVEGDEGVGGGQAGAVGVHQGFGAGF